MSAVSSPRRQADTLAGWFAAAIKLGVPSVLALGFAYWLAASVSGDIREMRREHRDLAFYLRQICVETANANGKIGTECDPPR